MTSYTFGVEEEYLWESPQGQPPPFSTWAGLSLPFAIGHEAHAEVVELISPVCHSLSEVALHLRKSRTWLLQQSQEHQSGLFMGGTHPTRDWMQAPLTDLPYYQKVIGDYGATMRGNFIFGMHTHIGGIAKHHVPGVYNALRPYLPLLIAASANSTHWRGQDTGLACYRLCNFSRMPRTGMPPRMTSVSELLTQLDDRLKSGCIERKTQVWHDLRYHPTYFTLENRVMDMQHDPDLAVGLGLLSLAMTIQLDTCGELLDDWSENKQDWIVEENRWRAIKDGVNARFLNSKKESFPVKMLLRRVLHAVRHMLIDADPQAYDALNAHFNDSREVISCS